MNRRELPGTAWSVLALLTAATLASCAQDDLSEVREPITLPAQFVDSAVATVTRPTAVAFTPDRRLLITSQSGPIRVFKNNALLPTPAADFASRICTNSERGVLGIAVDPDFATTKHVFIFYTSKRNGSCANNNASGGGFNRVSRFTYNTDNDTLDLGSERVVVDNIWSLGGNHNGGDVHFGADGFLYISVGDSGCQLSDGSRCGGGNTNAKFKSTLSGKILRVGKDGSIPSSNPFVGQSGARRCGDPAVRIDAVLNNTQPCTETFAWGLRNPFRMAFKEGTNQFFINDVGQNVWEEIDEGVAGANYGWSDREGFCTNGSSSNCTPDSRYRDPIHAYGRSGGCVSITGGAFVPTGVFGSSFNDSYLFGDYGCGKIFKLTRNSAGAWVRSDFATQMGGSSVTSLRFGPSPTGDGRSLYYTTYNNDGSGQVRRISFTGSQNRPPAALISATPTSGNTPLIVNFDGGASRDPDGDTLSYRWNFGNGETRTTTTPTTSFTYTAAGSFTASLVVADPAGATSSPATVVIRPGNTAPTVTIVSPADGALFSVDQTITLTGRATDEQDGTLPANRLSWEVLRHHAEHNHPYFSGTGNNLTFAAPPPEDLLAATNSYLEVRLTATDSNGLSTTVSRDIDPQTVQLTFATSPAGLNVVLDSTTTVPGGRTITSWANWGLRVFAPNQQDASGQRYRFGSWSDGGAADHVIVTPSSARTYTATFTPETGGGFSAKVNFQPAASEVPAGYVADTGEVFGARPGTGLAYGWNLPTNDVRERSMHADQRFDTLNHLQKAANPNASWEIEVPNGTYDVRVVMGDSAHFDSKFRLAAEGVLIVSGDPTTGSRFVDATAVVTVTDGRLTLGNGTGATNNKICFVDITAR